MATFESIYEELERRDRSKELNESHFNDMYELYEFILRNNIVVNSSKEYSPINLVTRIFFSTVTRDFTYVPRPIREKVKETRENEEKMIKKYNTEVWHRNEKNMDRIEAWVDKMYKTVGGVNTCCFFQYIPGPGLRKYYKLHITAPPEKALEFVEYVSAVLEHWKVPFKVVNSDFWFHEMDNTIQEGKLITIYPPSKDPKKYIPTLAGIAEFFKDVFDVWKYYKSDNEELNKKIEEKINKLFGNAPSVYTDEKFEGGNGNFVYYRYSYEDDDPDDRDPNNKLKGMPRLEEYLSNNINEIPGNVKKLFKE